MVNFPTWTPDCDSHSPALFNLFISSDASTCSTLAFCPLGNSYHMVVSVFIIPLKLKLGFPISFHSLCLFPWWLGWSSFDHLRDDVLLLLLVNFGVGSGWNICIYRIGLWTWIWSARHSGLGQKMACSFQCMENWTGFVWLV